VKKPIHGGSLRLGRPSTSDINALVEVTVPRWCHPWDMKPARRHWQILRRCLYDLLLLGLTERFDGILHRIFRPFTTQFAEINIELMSPAERSTRHILDIFVDKLRVVGLGPSGQWLGSLGCFWTRPSSLLKSTFWDRLWCFLRWFSLVRISGNFPGQMHGIPPATKSAC
jgi:hypothetical protein